MSVELELANLEVETLERALEQSRLRVRLLQEKESYEERIASISERIRSLQPRQRPLLILPRLSPDRTSVHRGVRDHLQPQTDQMVGIMKALSSPEDPFIDSIRIKEYIEENFEIPDPGYWNVRTNPKEPVRWWKNIYDKVIERLDLTEGIVVRQETTGKKGRYALKEYAPIQLELPFVQSFDAQRRLTA